MKLEIPSEIFNLANKWCKYFTPLNRYSGFQENSSQKRGEGDLTDLLGSLMFFSILADKNCVCGLNLISGAGDKSDLFVIIGDQVKTVNVKTSTYHPYRDDLRLFIKEEELDKHIDIYIQAFIHLNNKQPHVHFAGWIPKSSKRWNDYCKPLVIPNTGGHRGYGIPINKLATLDALIAKTDKKF